LIHIYQTCRVDRSKLEIICYYENLKLMLVNLVSNYLS